MNRREALRTISMGGALGAVAAGAVYAVSPAAASEPDAELIRLGNELVAAFRTEIELWEATRDDPSHDADAKNDTAYDARVALCEQIAALPATTVAGICIKGFAVATCEDVWVADGEDLEHYVGDRLSFQIRRDLRRLA